MIECLIGVLLMAATHGAIAHDEPAPSLPPIEVHASTLPPDLDELPTSSSRVERATLVDGQYQVDLAETLNRVPGLTVNDRQNHAQDLQLSLRGFGARASFGVRGLRLYTDGIPATQPDGQGQISHFDLPSAGRIVVLRGPFSALYGSSSGGVVELSTLEPAQSFAEIAAAGAGDGMQRHSALGAWVGEHWNAVGSGGWFETDGYRAHSAATRAGGQARVAIDAGGNEAVLLANVLAVSADDPLGLTRAQWEADPRQAGTNAALYDARKTVRQSQVGGTWRAALGDDHGLRTVAWVGTRDTMQFQAIPDTVQGTVADNPTHPGGVIDLERAYYGTDLRWLGRARSSAGSWQLALGADAEVLDEERRGFQNYIGTPGPSSVKGVQGELRRDESNRATGIDPYAQIAWRPTDDWLAVAGLRQANLRVTTDDRFVIAGNGDDSGSVTFHSWLPVAGVRLERGPFAVHIATARGAETPTLNELAYRPDGSAGLNPGLRAARSSHHELGASWRAESLQADVALFHIETRDEIVVASSSGGRTSFRNAAGTVRDGVEAGALARPTPATTIVLAYTFLDARYEDFAGGNRLPGIARDRLFGELAWRHRAAGAALEAEYRGRVSVNDADTDAAPGLAVLNLRIDWEPGAGFELFARIDNLFDRRYVGSVIVNESNGRYFEPAPDRAIGAGVRWRSRGY